MAGPDTPILEIYVQPGESHLVSQPAVLRTVLGSCVGITFLVPRLGIGAICHPMMPSCPPAQRTGMNVSAARRYVDFAIHDIASRLDSLGAVRGEVLVKLFGGNDVLTINGSDPQKTIGKQNYEAALQVLAEEGFTVVALAAPRAFTSHLRPFMGKCGCAGSIPAHRNRREISPGQLIAPIAADKGMGDCNRENGESSRTDRGRLRRRPSDVVGDSLLRPGNRSDRNRRRSLCCCRAHRRKRAGRHHSRY